MLWICGTVTRVYALPAEVSPRADPGLLHEWKGDIPFVPEGGMLAVGHKHYRVRYRSVVIDEDSGGAVVAYVVQDSRERIRI